MSNHPMPEWRAALESHFDRTGWVPVEDRTPLHTLMEREDAAVDTEPPGDEEFRQRSHGAKMLVQFIVSRGVTPAAMLRQFAIVAHGMGVEPFASLTGAEQALMFDETRAAVSWRSKVLSGEIELRSGARGRLAGQRSAETSAACRKAQLGNSNRRGTGKANETSPARGRHLAD